MKLLVTGATGFIGSALLRSLKSSGTELFALARKAPLDNDIPGGVRWLGGDLTSSGNLLKAVGRLDVVVHLAARAHVIKEKSSDPLREYRKVNVQGTVDLARQAAREGARRFVFMSSIGIHGKQSSRPITVNDLPSPRDPYAVSKLEAEKELRKVAEETGMELVVIRPPLVYGPGASGNFSRLVRVIASGVPLPLSAVSNKRSLVALDNLLDLIRTCFDHPAAAGEVFLVSDGNDISTPELIRKIAGAMNRPARLFPIPSGLLHLGGYLAGRAVEIERLCDTLQVDINYTRRTLGWQPPVSVHDAIEKAVTEDPAFSPNKH